jgi:hypothetical protein
MKLSLPGTAAVRKILMFGVMGAAGCSIGWLLGEPVLRILKPVKSETSQLTPSLVFSGELASRLQREGAKTGDVQISLMWNNFNDLDLHCIDPPGEQIFFGHKRSRSGGELDVDMNATLPLSDKPVENIYWPRGGAPAGKYQVFVNHYANHGSPDPTDYRCEVGVQGKVQKFAGSLAHGDPPRLVYEFTIGQPTPVGPSQFWSITLMQALWTALLSLGLAFALVIGQNHYLRRKWLSFSQGWLLIVGATAVGMIAGTIGQMLYGFVGQWAALAPAGRLLGWILLGGLLGRGMAYFIPNLPAKRAAWAGAGGGLVGALAFVASSGSGSDVLGRLLGAAILGFAIGLMVALAEAVSRAAWLEIQYGPKESRSVNLGPQPITIGSNRELCTIYAHGAPPVALRYIARDDRISCEDAVAARAFEVSPGDRRTAGNVTVIVRAAKASTSTAPTSTDRVQGTGPNSYYLRIRGQKTLLDVGVKLKSAVIKGLTTEAFDGVVAEVVRNPNQREVLGLKNLSTKTWFATTSSGETRVIEPGKSIKLATGTKITFGDLDGDIV